MSGLLRNLLTVIGALRHWRSMPVQSHTSAWFLVTPLDTGFSRLKSDKYLQLAEAAQVDYVIKTGLLATIRQRGCAFVNLSQLVRFARPVHLFSRVRVDTYIVYADARHAWFCHCYYVGPVQCAEVLVKMKFKRGTLTVAPSEFIGPFTGPQPAFVKAWDDALAGIAAHPAC